MPIYEFVCQTCGSEFEKIQSFSDKTAPICPRCQSNQVERQMSRPAIHFKGSGWYITDSKSDNKDRKDASGKTADSETKSTESGNKEAAPPSDNSSTKTEATKTETKSEAKAGGATEKSAAA
ncbi:MAG: zinc ribbon domain-containing protein [Caldilineaceae bacterium]